MIRIVTIIDSGLAWVEKVFLVVALSVMCLVVFLDFTLRELFNLGFIWAKELAAFLMVWVGFVGASLATRANKHLVVGIPEKLFPERILPYISFAVSLLVVGVTGFLTYLGWQYVMETREFGERSLLLGIPLWQVQIIIPVSLLIVAARFMGLGIKLLRGNITAIGGGDYPAETAHGKRKDV